MTVYGTVRKGRVVLDDPFALPHGQRVRVEAVAEASAPPEPGTESPAPVGRDEPTVGSGGAEAKQAGPPTLYERYKDFIGIADGLPPDMAENHDHYLYGRPKKS
jgi:hypothetical protein